MTAVLAAGSVLSLTVPLLAITLLGIVAAFFADDDPTDSKEDDR
jgi:hypothetical protein